MPKLYLVLTKKYIIVKKQDNIIIAKNRTIEPDMIYTVFDY